MVVVVVALAIMVVAATFVAVETAQKNTRGEDTKEWSASLGLFYADFENIFSVDEGFPPHKTPKKVKSIL